MSVELSILLLNIIIIGITYTSVYPKLAGKDLNKVALLDVVASSFAIIIVASKYWGSELSFEFLFMDFNWFWFTVISYCVIEIPIALWYFKGMINK